MRTTSQVLLLAVCAGLLGLAACSARGQQLAALPQTPPALATAASATPLLANPSPTVSPTPWPSPVLADPASDYCREQGYNLETHTAADGAAYRVCVLAPGRECDVWAFYRHQCGPAASPTPASVTPTPSATPTPTAPPTSEPQRAPGLAAALPPAVTERIDALFAGWDRPDSPGCAIGLGQAGKLEYARGYGMANLEHGIPITASTVFNTGSISKEFTGLAIALLRQEGKVSLDEDIRTYVPEMPAYGAPVTIRQLLAHTSGVRDDRTLALMAGWRDEDLLTEQDLRALVFRQQGLNFTPGKQFLYSNSNFGLLALVVERQSGQPLEQFAAERIFAPLDMKDTLYASDPQAVVPGGAFAYEPARTGYRLSMPNVAVPGPSSLLTTVGDLVLWADNFSTGRVGGLPAVQQMMQPAWRNDGATVYYNFGLNLRSYAGLGRTVSHDGKEGGFRSQLLVLPDRRSAVAVLCNLESVDPWPLAEQAARIYLGLAITPTPTPSPEPTVPAESYVSLPADQLAARAGTYFEPDTTHFMKLYAEEGRLKYQGLSSVQFLPLSADRFRIFRNGKPSSGTAVFSAAANGKLKLVLKDAATFTGNYEPYPDLPTDGGGYAGTYFSPELDTTYTISVKEGILTLDSRRFVAISLLPLGQDRFVMADALPAISVDFTKGEVPTRGDANQVDGFTLSLDRARGVVFKRLTAGQ